MYKYLRCLMQYISPEMRTFIPYWVKVKEGKTESTEPGALAHAARNVCILCENRDATSLRAALADLKVTLRRLVKPHPNFNEILGNYHM